MEMHELNVYPTILGDVSRGFWNPFLDSGARSAIFWHLKTGTFGPRAKIKSLHIWIIVVLSKFWSSSLSS